jgi:hypothetical protein
MICRVTAVKQPGSCSTLIVFLEKAASANHRPLPLLVLRAYTIPSGTPGIGTPAAKTLLVSKP